MDSYPRPSFHYSLEGELSGGGPGIDRIITVSEISSNLMSVYERNAAGIALRDFAPLGSVRGVAKIEIKGPDTIQVSINDSTLTYNVLQWFSAFHKRLKRE